MSRRGGNENNALSLTKSILSDGNNNSNRRWTGRFFSSRILFFLGFLATSIPLIYLTFFTSFFDKLHMPSASNHFNVNLRNKIEPEQRIEPPQIEVPQVRPKGEVTPRQEPLKPVLEPPMKKIEEITSPPAQEKTPIVPSGSNKNPKETPNLPGAKDHPILRLSDEELMNTPVDKLMAPYGESDGGGSCFQDFGNTLSNRWRDTKKTYCAHSGPNAPSQLQSQIDCYLVHQTRHHGNGDNLCKMENVALDLAIFADEGFTKKVIEEYVNTRHMKQPYPPFPKGFLQADCRPEPNYWQTNYMPGWNADLTTKALDVIPVSASNRDEICSEWIEDRTVMLAERDTFANFFHDSEDFVNMFLALSILQIKPKDLQVFLMDLYPKGPFWEMWSEVYSHHHQTLTAWDLKQKFANSRGSGQKKKYICFKSLAVGIYGPAAPITVASWDTSCHRTALVRAYSDFVIRSLHLHQFSHYALPSPSKTITITYMSRRPSAQWPERKYCDDENSFFKCHYWENFGPRHLGRMVTNDNEVVDALKRLETQTDFLDELPAGTKIKFQAVDFNVLSFKEQIQIDLETDILIGPHGAGLTHSLFMRDRAVLIELFIDGSGANRHFHNFAFWYGRGYDGVAMGNPINTRELISIVKRNVKKIHLDSY